MCLVLPSRVVRRLGTDVEVELADGQRAVVSAELKPDLSVGDYVLVDRGLVVETIAADEAHTILAMYAEIGALLEAEDAALADVTLAAIQGSPPRPTAKDPCA